tara:strand:- start:5414 stop:5590 length:177 start_codon:yes stop_codon:yes gene_type:complete
MLFKEAITQVARKLKEDEVTDHSFTQLLDNYPKDLSEDDLKLALRAMEIVCSVVLKVD